MYKLPIFVWRSDGMDFDPIYFRFLGSVCYGEPSVVRATDVASELLKYGAARDGDSIVFQDDELYTLFVLRFG